MWKHSLEIKQLSTTYLPIITNITTNNEKNHSTYSTKTDQVYKEIIGNCGIIKIQI